MFDGLGAYKEMRRRFPVGMSFRNFERHLQLLSTQVGETNVTTAPMVSTISAFQRPGSVRPGLGAHALERPSGLSKKRGGVALPMPSN